MRSVTIAVVTSTHAIMVYGDPAVGEAVLGEAARRKKRRSGEYLPKTELPKLSKPIEEMPEVELRKTAKESVKHMLGVTGRVKWGEGEAIFWGTSVLLSMVPITRKILENLNFKGSKISMEVIKSWSSMKALSNISKETMNMKLTVKQFFTIVIELCYVLNKQSVLDIEVSDEPRNPVNMEIEPEEADDREEEMRSEEEEVAREEEEVAGEEEEEAEKDVWNEEEEVAREVDEETEKVEDEWLETEEPEEERDDLSGDELQYMLSLEAASLPSSCDSPHRPSCPSPLSPQDSFHSPHLSSPSQVSPPSPHTNCTFSPHLNSTQSPHLNLTQSPILNSSSSPLASIDDSSDMGENEDLVDMLGARIQPQVHFYFLFFYLLMIYCRF